MGITVRREEQSQQKAGCLRHPAVVAADLGVAADMGVAADLGRDQASEAAAGLAFS
jgi:hypothetical protein